MRNRIVRRPARLLVTVVLALLASGCGGHAGKPAATPSPSTSAPSSPSTSTPSPTTLAATTTASRPLTDEELAWLRSITKLHQNIDKVFLQGGSVTITPSKLRSWETVLRSCSKELTRLGSPGERLQPVLVLVQKACKQFDRGAACFAVAARNLNSASATKTVEQNLTCGENAEGDGSNLLGDAEAKGKEIDLAAG
jgi:hypothetical protein